MNQKTLEQHIQEVLDGQQQHPLYIKNEPTLLRAVHDTEVGGQVITYTGVDTQGALVQETYGGGVATLHPNSVVLRNPVPIQYPIGHPQSGEVVQGTYQHDGSFVIGNGQDVLFNQWVSDKEYVKCAYGVEPTLEWISALKLKHVQAMQLPADCEPVVVTTKEGVGIHVKAGDYVIFQSENVHACEKKLFEQTYIPKP
ncbi:MAG: hypothetical protein ACMXYC_03960 [Candidatus Woesearchaeota archaeon]